MRVIQIRRDDLQKRAADDARTPARAHVCVHTRTKKNLKMRQLKQTMGSRVSARTMARRCDASQRHNYIGHGYIGHSYIGRHSARCNGAALAT